MSRRVLVPLGLLSLATDPAGSSVGDSYFNTASGKIRIYDGEEWQDAGISATDLSTAISGAALDTTDDLPEGTTNLYHTVQHTYNALTSGTRSNITFALQSGVIDVSVPTVQGTQGTQGTLGAQGTQGTVGTQGVQGSEGTQGAQGTVGSQGVQGTQGTQGVQGTVGTQGTSGTQGVQGYSGVDGNSSSYYNYKIKTGTTSGDPGDGYIIYNNATQTSATAFNIDHLTSSSVDIDLFLSLLKEGDTLVIQDENNSDNYQQWTVNGAETIVPNNYVTVPVTLVTSNGTGTTGFANNQAVILVIVATGVQGPSGAQGAQGIIGAQGVQGTTGTQGVQGTQGTQGTTGAGTQGTSGASILTTSNSFTGTSNVFTGQLGVGGSVNAGVQAVQSGFQSATGLGYVGIPVNPTSTGSYTVLVSDAGTTIYSSATRTITIPTGISWGAGTTFVFVAGPGATVTIAPTNTTYLAGVGSTGNRTLAPFGVATLLYLGSGTTWIISGVGLT